MKLIIQLIPSDFGYNPNPNRDGTTDCVVARAFKRALKREDVQYNGMICGYQWITIFNYDRDQTIELPPRIKAIIERWMRENYSASLITINRARFTVDIAI